MAKNDVFQLRLDSATKAEWKLVAAAQGLSLAAWLERAAWDEVALWKARRAELNGPEGD